MAGDRKARDPGNAAQADGALVRAAAKRDGQAFGQLFDRYLPIVFDTAWQVLGEREAAAEITRDTFADAWFELPTLQPEGFRAWLFDRTRARAFDWLAVHEPQRHVAAGAPTAPAEAIGPMLRARIVAALEMQGVATRAAATPGWWRSKKPIDQSAYPTALPPSAATGAAHAAPTQPALVRARQAIADVFGSTGGRLGAAAAALVLVLLAVAGTVVFTGDGGDSTDAASAADAADRLQTTTSTTASTTTSTSTSTSTTTTSTSTTTTTEPPPETAPPTTARPAPPPPPPSTTPTTAPPPEPDIVSFWGTYFGRRGDGDCADDERNITLWWNTQNATNARIRHDGGQWSSVSVGIGTQTSCSEPGDRWYMEASNSAGVVTTSDFVP